MEERIPDKVTMRDLFMRGQFGNRWPAWTLDEYIRDGVELDAGLMYNGRPGTRLPNYCLMLKRVDVAATALEWISLGCDRNRITVSRGSQDVPGIRIVLQGEIQRDENYYTLLYSTQDTYMRDALAESPQHATGLHALLLLQRHMDAASLDTINDLFDRYPSAVIEFTTYDRSAGILGHNTVIWEVRHY